LSHFSYISYDIDGIQEVAMDSWNTFTNYLSQAFQNADRKFERSQRESDEDPRNSRMKRRPTRVFSELGMESDSSDKDEEQGTPEVSREGKEKLKQFVSNSIASNTHYSIKKGTTLADNVIKYVESGGKVVILAREDTPFFGYVSLIQSVTGKRCSVKLDDWKDSQKDGIFQILSADDDLSDDVDEPEIKNTKKDLDYQSERDSVVIGMPGPPEYTSTARNRVMPSEYSGHVPPAYVTQGNFSPPAYLLPDAIPKMKDFAVIRGMNLWRIYQTHIILWRIQNSTHQRLERLVQEQPLITLREALEKTKKSVASDFDWAMMTETMCDKASALVTEVARMAKLDEEEDDIDCTEAARVANELQNYINKTTMLRTKAIEEWQSHVHNPIAGLPL
jgi:hypothetical protein